MAINSLLARLGTADPVEPCAALEDLLPRFDLGRFSRAAPKLDVEEIRRLNGPVLHASPFAAVRDRLEVAGLAGIDEAFWLAIRANLSRFDEAALWWSICRAVLEPRVDDPEFAGRAAASLPPEPWDETTWGAWTRSVAEATGRKGRALFMPLRLALTAREHGPELKTLLPILGRARAEARLRGIAA
jgi:glutamyl-tRNA synthetase